MKKLEFVPGGQMAIIGLDTCKSSSGAVREVVEGGPLLEKIGDE